MAKKMWLMPENKKKKRPAGNIGYMQYISEEYRGNAYTLDPLVAI